MNILVTGANGQLGSEIKRLSKQVHSHIFTFVDIDEMDLTSESSILSFLRTGTWDIIVNCAAYTAVDKAETDPAMAYAINSESAKIIAEYSTENNITLIHISTDFVFDGKGNEPIGEDHEPNPINVYGKSKLEGEKHIQARMPNAYIIRTSWLYSSFGNNFVRTIIRLANERSALNVVYDQIGTPTYAGDLAKAIMKIVDNISNKVKDYPGVYHYSNEGVASWYDLAHRVVDYLRLDCRINPVTSEEYKAAAARPKFSVLSKRKIKETLGAEIPHWSTSLIACLEELKKGSGR